MFKLKKQFNRRTVYICLIIFIGLLFMFNNQSVMAMQNNKNQQILEKEPTDEKVNKFFRLVKKQKEIIQNIKQKNPNLKNASIKEIEQWCCSGIEQKFECQFSNKKPKKINLDLNIIPEDQ